MAHEIWVRRDEFPERSVDLVEMNVGDKSIDPGIDAAGFRAEQESVIANQVRQGLQVRNSPLEYGVGVATPDTLIIVPFEIVFSGLLQTGFRHAGMRPEDLVSEQRPELRIAPSRI